MLYYNQDRKMKGEIKMKDLEVLKILGEAEQEGIIEGYEYYEEEEVKFLIEDCYSALSVHKAHKLDQLFEMLDKAGVNYYELKEEECE